MARCRRGTESYCRALSSSRYASDWIFDGRHAHTQHARRDGQYASGAICDDHSLYLRQSNWAEVERHFRSGLGRRYDKFFVNLLWKQNLQRWKLHPEEAPNKIPRPPRRLRELDEIVTAPTGGFRSAADYYEQSSPGPKLAAIRQPVTIFSSEDDPIVPVGPLLSSSLSDSTELVTSTYGGHLGFFGCLAMATPTSAGSTGEFSIGSTSRTRLAALKSRIRLIGYQRLDDEIPVGRIGR